MINEQIMNEGNFTQILQDLDLEKRKERYTVDKAMLGAKAPGYDACGLFRAAHSHNPTQYSYIVGYASHFYAHIRAGPKALTPLMSKLMWVQAF